MKSLKALHSMLADAGHQVDVLEQNKSFPSFTDKLNAIGLLPLKPARPEIFQVNIGKMCNQVCRHCHVDAGPDRKEIMTMETMQQCL